MRHKVKIQELMNDKFEEFHKGNRQAEENLKRVNDQKARTFFFNKNCKCLTWLSAKSIEVTVDIILQRGKFKSRKTISTCLPNLRTSKRREQISM